MVYRLASVAFMPHMSASDESRKFPQHPTRYIPTLTPKRGSIPGTGNIHFLPTSRRFFLFAPQLDIFGVPNSFSLFSLIKTGFLFLL